MRENLNKRLMIQLVAALVVLATGVFLLNRFQVRSNVPELRALAQAAKAQDRPDRAARLLGLYLSFAPNDTEARADYGFLLESMAETPRGRREAIAAFEAVLLEDPARNDVRTHLARLYLNARNYSEAFSHLKPLRQALPNDAWVAFQLGVCLQERREYSEAVKEYLHAIQVAPNSVGAYAQLADLLRRRLDDPDEADRTIDRMVRNNPRDFQVYLFRARHRRALKAADAEEDLRQALALKPNDIEVLLLSAEWEKAKGRLPQAKRFLQKALDKHPDEDRPHHALALLEVEAGEIPQAIARLRQAAVLFPGNPRLLSTLATLLTDQRDLPAARSVIAEMRRWKVAPPQVAVLQAEADAAEGKWQEARDALEANRPLLVTTAPHQLLRVDLLLGRCYEHLGEADLELAAFRRAAQAAPNHAGAQAALTQVLLRRGRLTEAIAQQRKLTAGPGATADALFTFAKLLVLERLSSQTTDPRWPEAEAALDRASQQMPGAVGIDLLRAEILAAQNKTAEAQRLLEATATRHPRALEVSVALATLASRRGKPAEVKSLLDAAEKRLGPSVELCLARLQLAASLQEARSSGAITAAEQHLARLKGADQLRLVQGFAESHSRWQNLPEARRLWLKVADLSPEDLPVRLRLFDLAAQLNDAALMERMVREIQKREGKDGPLGQYGEAILLITQARGGATGGLEQARRHLATAASRRPAWAAVPAARAMIAELEGKPDEALAEYLRALDLGESRVAVVSRAVQMLTQGERDSEVADRLIKRLYPDGPLSPELRKLAAEVSLRNADLGRALKLAAAAVPPDSKDPQDHVWLAQVLMAAGRPAEAGAALRRAVGLAGTSGAPWVALVIFHHRQGDPKKAEEVIREAREKLKGPEARLTFAQCLEAVGKRGEAETEYRSAVEAAPKDLRALRNLATFYQRINSPAQAVPRLRHLLSQGQLSQEDVSWTRRGLATSLAATAEYSNFKEALTLIGQNLSAAPQNPADVFTRAQILGTRPEHRPEALQLLQQLARKQRLSTDQEFYLARLAAAAGKWPVARKALLEILSRKDGKPSYVAFFVEQLFQNGEKSDAEVWLGRLERLAPDSPDAVSLRALALVKQGNSQEAVALVRSHVQRAPAGKEKQLDRFRFAAQLLEQLAGEAPARGKVLLAAAEEMFRRAAESTKLQDSLGLAQYLGRRHRFAEALRLCDDGKAKGPALTVAVASITIVCSGPATEAQLEAVQRFVKDSSKGAREASSWNALLAALYARRGRYADAAASYRLILAENDRDAGSLNNLALMLMYQDRHEEALTLVEKAMTQAGPTAELLDTRAQVYLQAGKTDRAIADLTTALAHHPTPVRHFHMAQAFNKAGRQTEATAMLRKAATARADRSLVLPVEQRAYQQLLQELNLKADGKSAVATGRPTPERK